MMAEVSAIILSLELAQILTMLKQLFRFLKVCIDPGVHFFELLDLAVANRVHSRNQLALEQ